ncbi:DUF6234 family protein [Streptomyces sp. NBC_00691]|uniref:DUF6234 family protein n=1 Tax=Streptomyces sp. NBC_00691 TaxID=2903671 RepID=UPI002E35439C|nr:DUF6234 family protein [Streptomyces sp. NBC_00691]
MTRHTLGSERTGDHADRGADIGAGCGLLVLELALLVVIFGAWLLTGVSLDPAKPGRTDPLSGYLPWAGGVGLLAFGVTVIAARAKAMITVISQGFMATLVAVVIAGGLAAQRVEDGRDRPVTEQSDTGGGCRSGGDSGECARSGG